MLAPSVAPSRATFSTLTQETMKETKDGIFIGAMSPLLQCIENTYTDGGVLTTGPRTVRSLRVVQFVRAVEYACENFAALNSTVERQRWTHQEFRALCEAAGPVAAELSARALQNDGLDSAPVSESMLLEYLACHVSKATKEKVSKLAMVGRMVAAPSHRGTHGGTPVSMLSKATLAAVATPAFPAQPVAAENSLSSDAVPSTVAAPVDGRKRPGTEAKLALPKGRPQPSAEGRRPGSPPPPDKPERQLNGEKQMVIMPWTIPAPFNFGVLLRRVTPKTFKAPATLPQTIPTVADIANAAATDKAYALWVARETALRRGAVEHAPKSSVADDDDEAATLPAGPSGLAPPGPIFPHSSAQGAGLKQPSGIGSAAVAESSNPASSRHVNLRKPLLTAIAHYGIHTVHKTTPS